MLDKLHKESFARCLNTDFSVMDEGSAALSLKLTEITEGFMTPRQEAFSVIFHGPADQFIQQGIHKLRHTMLGELEIFLVPIAKDGDGFQYEAVFNHLIQSK